MPSRSRLLDFEAHGGAQTGILKPTGGFHFFDRHHLDGVPGAAIEEGAIGTLAGAFLAADAEHGIDFDVAEGRMILVGHPVHAVGHRAIRHAGGRAGAARAAFRDDGQFLGPFLAGVAMPSDLGSIFTTAVAM